MNDGKKKDCTAVVLSAGQGRRMGSSVQKQYIEIEGRPVIYYTLKAFQESRVIDDIVLVVGKGQEQYAEEEIVQKYQFSKVRAIVEGGAERYDSVWQGLLAIRDGEFPGGGRSDYVFIHDGARMLVDEETLERGYETVLKYRACVAGMPSKDTVKLVDEQAVAVQTPQRKFVWTVQTPQIFEKSLIIEAYSRLMREQCIEVTDDAMAVERMMDVPVKLFEASYENIKITTPEDLAIAESFLRRRNNAVKNES
ncbi:MAG: 2-C-methyl-D-erythritol 4-phosphate cytidylyltransferase [Dorea sp.]|jgi:2-C-methyl-D-erythritol 4-phosphate cytidylyltransferase|nr:2-C-methyl-D-erythritol 4-phosphate cytidylyltransferase [Dorea sp.]